MNGYRWIAMKKQRLRSWIAEHDMVMAAQNERDAQVALRDLSRAGPRPTSLSKQAITRTATFWPSSRTSTPHRRMSSTGFATQRIDAQPHLRQRSRKELRGPLGLLPRYRFQVFDRLDHHGAQKPIALSSKLNPITPAQPPSQSPAPPQCTWCTARSARRPRAVG